MAQNRSELNIVVALILGMGLTLGLLHLLSRQPGPVSAAGVAAEETALARQASGAVITVCLSGACPFDTIQAAVDAASDGDEIRVAGGTYTGVSARADVTQVVYISKTVTVRGGYAVTDWSESHPISRPTTLDAEGQGRVLYIAAGVSPTLEGLRITGGRAAEGGGDNEGGGVYVARAAPVITACEIVGNGARFGAGLYLDVSAADLRANTIVSNTADGDFAAGGGAYVNQGAPSLVENTFSSNAAEHAGGGLYLNNTAAALTDNAVVANQARSCGGLCLADSAATLVSNTITANQADGKGGGCYLYNSADTLSGNTITGNAAGGYGGGLFAYNGAFILWANTIAENSGERGGGICTNGGEPAIDQNMIRANSAETYGGGVYIRRSEAAIGQNLISANSAGEQGGGVYLDGGSSSLDANVIVDNVSELGGGLYLLGTDATLINTVVARNQASTAGEDTGQAMHIVGGSSPRLLHTTLVGRQAGGGDTTGVSVLGASAEFLNTILVRYGVGVYAGEGALVSLEGTLWGSGAWANGQDWAGPGELLQLSSIRADPAFVDPEEDDYHLKITSPAVNRGLPTQVGTDMDGHPRPIPAGGRSDLGADECTGIDLSGSRKTAAPYHPDVGEPMTYTLTLLNSGYASATNVVLHDEVPTATTYVSRSAQATAGQLSDEGSIAWTGTLVPRQLVTITFAVIVDEEVLIYNAAFVTDAYGTSTRLTAWSNGERHFLPLVSRSY